MAKNNKITRFFLTTTLLLSFQSPCLANKDNVSNKENLDPQPPSASLKRKYAGDSQTDYSNLKRYKRAQKAQGKKLSIQSPYVKGDFCAQIRWVSTLGTYYGSIYPERKVEVPGAIHHDLAFVGNHLKACYVLSDTRPDAADKKNILVPHLSFIGKKEGAEREFFKGDYLHLGNAQDALAFISGPTVSSMEDKYKQYAKYWNPRATVNFLPPVKMIAGDIVSQLTGKNFDHINAASRQAGKPESYQFHSEEWFHEMVGAHPQMVINPIIKQLSPGDKVYALVFDLYSWWDVCNHCQQNFKKAQFQRETIRKFQALLDEKGIRYPQNGLKVIFRVSSERSYFSDVNYQQIKTAGGGYSDEEGFDIKSVDLFQVTLCTRPYPTYDKVSSKVTGFFARR